MSPIRSTGWPRRSGRPHPWQSGLVIGSPIFLLVIVLTVPDGLGAVTGVTALLAVGLVLAVLGAPSGRVPAVGFGSSVPWWCPSAATGLAAGLLAVLAWAVTGGPAGVVRLAVLAAVSLWVSSATFLSSSTPRAQCWAVSLALAALLALAGAGYALGAGLVYYLGQPLALVVLLAGRAATGVAESDGREHGLGLAGTGQVIASMAMALFALMDLV